MRTFLSRGRTRDHARLPLSLVVCYVVGLLTVDVPAAKPGVPTLIGVPTTGGGRGTSVLSPPTTPGPRVSRSSP